MKNFYKKYLYISCHQATFLLSKRQETKLTLAERIRLRFHLLLCGPCTRFAQQIVFLQQSFSRLLDDSTKKVFNLSAEKKAILDKMIKDFLEKE